MDGRVWLVCGSSGTGIASRPTVHATNAGHPTRAVQSSSSHGSLAGRRVRYPHAPLCFCLLALQQQHLPEPGRLVHARPSEAVAVCIACVQACRASDHRPPSSTQPPATPSPANCLLAPLPPWLPCATPDTPWRPPTLCGPAKLPLTPTQLSTSRYLPTRLLLPRL